MGAEELFIIYIIILLWEMGAEGLVYTLVQTPLERKEEIFGDTMGKVKANQSDTHCLRS